MPLLTGLTPSGSKPAYSTFTLAKMVDNNNATVHMQNAGQVPGDWVKVDVGSSTTVTDIEIRQGYESLTDGNCFRTWVLEYSTDDTNWTTISSGNSFISGASQIVSATGLSITARYVRLRCTYSSTAWASFQEFRVWAADAAPSGALAATLPHPSVALTGTAPTPGALAATLPVLTVALIGGAPLSGELAVTLPLPTFAGAGTTPPPRTGYGLVLDSTATVSAPPPVDLTSDPVAPAGVPAPVQHVVVPTVPAPVLVNGRPS